jgi:hypothetical protein
MSHHTLRLLGRRLSTISTALLGLGLVVVSCADEGANRACSWLFAPTSFVDAGQPGCTAEPAGQTCDASTALCQNVCQPGEYVLTCLRSEISSLAIPEETLQDPVVSAGRGIKCSALAMREGSRGATAYCCRCEQ